MFAGELQDLRPSENLPTRIMQYHKLFITLGSLFAMTAVILGAFGAHFLKSHLPAEDLANFKTGVSYQFYHALGLLALGLIRRRWHMATIKWAGILMATGIVLFSGSLYFLSIMDTAGFGAAAAIVGPVTPLGGLCFILSWGLLFLESLRSHK